MHSKFETHIKFISFSIKLSNFWMRKEIKRNSWKFWKFWNFWNFWNFWIFWNLGQMKIYFLFSPYFELFAGLFSWLKWICLYYHVNCEKSLWVVLPIRNCLIIMRNTNHSQLSRQGCRSPIFLHFYAPQPQPHRISPRSFDLYHTIHYLL
jgi:hypothetical protein